MRFQIWCNEEYFRSTGDNPLLLPGRMTLLTFLATSHQLAMIRVNEEHDDFGIQLLVSNQ